MDSWRTAGPCDSSDSEPRRERCRSNFRSSCWSWGSETMFATRSKVDSANFCAIDAQLDPIACAVLVRERSPKTPCSRARATTACRCETGLHLERSERSSSTTPPEDESWSCLERPSLETGARDEGESQEMLIGATHNFLQKILSIGLLTCSCFEPITFLVMISSCFLFSNIVLQTTASTISSP
jgi:hypothetical protein